MANYDDMYMRADLNDPGTQPYSGSPCHSPDIIPYGTLPVTDPVTVFTNNFNSDVGTNVRINEANYIYVRGRNNAAGATSGKAYLYYSPASLLNWPSIWSQNVIRPSEGADFISVGASAGGGAIWVADRPFCWIPGPLPATDNHYCLVGRVSTAAHPNDIPSAGTLEDFAKFVCQNRGYAWHNVSMVTGNPPTWTQTIQYSQGAVGGMVYIFLACHNIPIDCEVAFSCGTPGPNPMIAINRTKVSTYPNFTAGVFSSVPADFSSYITYSFWANGKAIPAGAYIQLQAQWSPPTGHDLLKYARPLQEVSGSGALILEGVPKAKLGGVGPTPVILLGQDTKRYAG